MNMFDQGIKWFTKDGKNYHTQPNFYGHIVIASVSLSLIIVCGYVRYHYANTKAEQWLSDITLYDMSVCRLNEICAD
jgi:hypothetical protein